MNEAAFELVVNNMRETDTNNKKCSHIGIRAYCRRTGSLKNLWTLGR